MNCEVFQLKELEVEHYQIREVLRCILHTIMFHRALGLVRPKDVDTELFDLTYVQCGDSAIEKKIDEKIEHFCTWVEKHPLKKGQVCLSFYERRNKQTWFSSKQQRLFWEQWCLQLRVVSNEEQHVQQQEQQQPLPSPSGSTPRSRDGAWPATPFSPERGTQEGCGDGVAEAEDRRQRTAALEAELRDVLLQVLFIVNEKRDHIPPVVSADVASFPYEITIPTTSDSAFGMDMLKRMLQTSPPAMLG
eukprot:TRINITY_DN33361_c0_g1_i1.p1 TRINITY_DN33361_c0_g1~~TRINITY_DN33361_c0_g1_i1.p1  ORF type:complete len:247 (+),score=49.62 TRINITY_DN33361_c0_g1_i1:321-1061(+)